MKKNELSKKIYNEKTIKKTEKKIKLLGLNNKIDTIEFLNIRLFTSIILFFVIMYITSFGYVLAPTITCAYYLLCDKILLDNKIKKRRKSLEDEAMHFFEVLTLSLETGRNLVEAIDVTTANVSGILVDEFKESLREVQFGKSLNEALTDMQKRIPSENVNNIILSLTQANLYGNSIINNLYGQIDYLREKRKLEVKGKISKVPVLISVISVLFFIPLLLMIILGPILLDYIG